MQNIIHKQTTSASRFGYITSNDIAELAVEKDGDKVYIHIDIPQLQLSECRSFVNGIRYRTITNLRTHEIDHIEEPAVELY